jgi:antibiotic biosynthesis monooxygenase (ABM) superfamily enzyme
MKLPFGLDLKTLIVTIVVMYFIVPYVQSFLAARTAKAA